MKYGFNGGSMGKDRESIKKDYDNQLLRIKENPFNISEIKDPTEALIIEAAKQNGFIIQYFTEISEQVALIAVRQNGLALEFIDNPSYETCLEAVKQNGLAILFVENQTEVICDNARKRGQEQVDNKEITQLKYDFDIISTCEY